MISQTQAIFMLLACAIGSFSIGYSWGMRGNAAAFRRGWDKCAESYACDSKP